MLTRGLQGPQNHCVQGASVNVSLIVLSMILSYQCTLSTTAQLMEDSASYKDKTFMSTSEESHNVDQKLLWSAACRSVTNAPL